MKTVKNPPKRVVFDIPEGKAIEVLHLGRPPMERDALEFLKEMSEAVGVPAQYSDLKQGWEVILPQTEEVWFRVAARELIEACGRP